MMEKKPHRGSENLIPIQNRTKEAQREIRSKGGIATGIVRRHQRNARIATKVLLNEPLTANERKFALETGANPETVTNKRELYIHAAIQKGVANGDTNSLVKILEIAGEHTEALDLNTSGRNEGRPVINIIQGGTVNQLMIQPQRVNGSPMGTDRDE